MKILNLNPPSSRKSDPATALNKHIIFFFFFFGFKGHYGPLPQLASISCLSPAL